MIFQEPMTSLNPLHSIEKQIAESLKLHQGLTGAAAQRPPAGAGERPSGPRPATPDAHGARPVTKSGARAG